MADAMGMSTAMIAAQRDVAFDRLASSTGPVARLTETAALGVSVFLFSFVNGRFKNPKIMDKAPVDLTAALVLGAGTLAADWFIGLPDWANMAGDNLSRGAMASFLAKLGTGWGAEMGDSSAGYDGAYGTLPGSSVGALSADEAAIYVR